MKVSVSLVLILLLPIGCFYILHKVLTAPMPSLHSHPADPYRPCVVPIPSLYGPYCPTQPNSAQLSSAQPISGQLILPICPYTIFITSYKLLMQSSSLALLSLYRLISSQHNPYRNHNVRITFLYHPRITLYRPLCVSVQLSSAQPAQPSSTQPARSGLDGNREATLYKTTCAPILLFVAVLISFWTESAGPIHRNCFDLIFEMRLETIKRQIGKTNSR